MNDIVAVAAALLISSMIAATILRGYSENERTLLWMSYAAHLVSALGIIVVVRAAYGSGDMFGYFHVGQFLAEQLRSDFFDMAPRLIEILFQRAPPLPLFGISAGSNTGCMQALSGFICLFTGDSLYAANILIATASFVSKVMLFNAVKAGLPDVPGRLIAIACTLVPSAVFWSSGLLKEPIAVVGLSAMVYGGHLIVNQQRWLPGVIALGGGTLLAGLFKGYLVPPFGIGAGFFYLSRALFASGRTIRPRFVVLGAVLALASILVTGAALPHFSPDTFEEEARDAQAIGQRVTGGSSYSYGEGSLVSQLPLALLTVLYRPVIFEASGFLVFVNSLETLAAAVLTIIGLSRTPLNETLRYILTRPTLCFCVGFVLTLAAGVGLTTTNLGTLSRYRMPLVPFYATVLLVLATRRARAPAPAPFVFQPASGFGSRLGGER